MRHLRILLPLCLWLVAASATAAPIGQRAAPQDGFPVFNDPPMLGVAEAERQQVVFPRDMVIGVSLGGEAKAYPITIMGVHELGNDTLGGQPIAVSW